MGLEYGPNGSSGKADLRDAAAAENKVLPIHRWVPWIAGFSAPFVQDAIEAYLPRGSRNKQLVLDPFAGVGTTLIEAVKAGCNTTGYSPSETRLHRSLTTTFFEVYRRIPSDPDGL
jgi:hypothetical protein